MADGAYGLIGFISTLFLNALFSWIHIEDVGKAIVLGFAGAVGGIAAKHSYSYIKTKIQILYTKLKNKKKQ